MSPHSGDNKPARPSEKLPGHPNWDDYEMLDVLGRGNFGTVYKVKEKETKKLLVVKEINTSTSSKKHSMEAFEEINIMAQLKEKPFIVKYFDSFVEEKYICIVMEFCERGDLNTYLTKLNGKLLTENVIWKFFVQICVGLYNLHS